MTNLKDYVKSFYEINEKGKGFRSIGKWGIYEKTGDILDIELSEHQKKHAEKILEKYGLFILMKEAYADKYRIHDPYSFICFFKCNLYGSLVYGSLSVEEKKLNDACMMIIKNAPLENQSEKDEQYFYH